MTRLKASPIILHLAAWMLFMSFPLLFMNQGKSLSDIDASTVWADFEFCGLYALLFYLHAYWLVPKYFLKKKYAVYVLSLFLLLGVVYFIRPFDRLVGRNRIAREMKLPALRLPQPGRPFDHPFGPPGEHKGMPPPPHRGPGEKRDITNFDITGLFIFVMMMGLGIALQSIKQWQLFEKRALEAEADKANAELSFLKAQINPHFLYNTLNNIYTLCITGSENAAESIMKLSNIMRYVTDKSEADFVPLHDEIECISNFIALQKLRLGKKVTLSYSVEGDPVGHKIAPLILMTFIENVFKYGLSNHLPSEISISLIIEDQKISFYTRNQIFGNRKQPARKGIGLENTKKRLDYLYSGSHSLKITNDGSFFTVLLVLESK